ncbi:protein AGENET DOMAIN (AGD)-CONTAINING P1 [Malania oleifera]|uniref:protein AGENET DOMAIN (AGD)-CONTAINING P1 n=1 Tax=Malania oleifera TaxID=397392 RepID=UPI0025AE0C10|nr:protein AGENET DOMAIN (AGD)-CONTAINING P1 [Malania oleifera]
MGETPGQYFKKGAEVEISSDDEGFRGAWYAGTVIRPASKKNSTIMVEYKSLMADEEGSEPLRELVDLVQLRPPPPRELGRGFKFSEEVDAFHNDGWWEGVVTEVLDGGRCSVFFRGSREQMDFAAADLRLHREWVAGKWVPPLEEEKVLNTTEVKSRKGMVKESFSKGTLVEVSSDEDGFQGAWFAATIIKAVGKDKFLIEYRSLRTEDDKEFLREEVDNLHIRPYPPETIVVDRFSLFEEVDALYNDGWWVGLISKVLCNSRYIVYFKSTDEEMEFEHSDLRQHQEWINGKWVMASEAFKL